MKRIAFLLLLLAFNYMANAEGVREEEYSDDPEIAYSQYYLQAQEKLFSAPREALPLALKALENAQAANLPYKIANTYLLQGLIQFQLNHLSAAYEGYARALSLYEQLGDIEMMGWCNWNIALIYAHTAQKDRTYQLLYSVQPILEEYSALEKNNAFKNDFAQIQIDFGELDAAINSLSNIPDFDSVINISYNKFYLGEAYYRKGNLDSARKFYQDAHTIATECSNAEVIIRALNGLANVSFLSKDYENSLTHYIAAKSKLSERPHLTRLHTEVVFNLALCYFKKDNTQDAVIEIRTFLNQLEPADYSLAVVDLYELYLSEYIRNEKPEMYDQVVQAKSEVVAYLVANGIDNPNTLLAQLALIDEQLAREGVESELEAIHRLDTQRAWAIGVVAVLLMGGLSWYYFRREKRQQAYVAQVNQRNEEVQVILDQYQATINREVRILKGLPDDE